MKIDFAALPIPPLPPLPEEGPGWWTVGVVVSPVPESHGEGAPVDIPSAPDVPPPEPDDPVRCYIPEPDRQFIPDPPPVMAEITGFSTDSDVSETVLLDEVVAYPHESKEDYMARVAVVAESAKAYDYGRTPGRLRTILSTSGKLLWQGFATVRSSRTRDNHYAAYMVGGDIRQNCESPAVHNVLCRAVCVDVFIYLRNAVGHDTFTCTDTRRYDGVVQDFGYGNVLHAGGGTIYWISDTVGSDGYYGVTTTISMNPETGLVEATHVKGTGLNNMGLPPDLAEQMIIRDWTGKAVDRRNYNPTMASSPSGLHALTGDSPYNMAVRSADEAETDSVYGTSDTTIVADSSGNKMQDSAGGGWYMVTTTSNQDGTKDVTVHGSGGPSVPPGSITSVTATRGFNEAGQSGVWWTFHRKQVCR